MPVVQEVAIRVINSVSSVEWMEFRSLHSDAKTALDAGAENAMMSLQAANALRALSMATSLSSGDLSLLVQVTDEVMKHRIKASAENERWPRRSAH
jgi:hypothetical protein